MEITDSELIHNSLEGDDDSFKELVNRHLKHVYGFIYNLTGNADESKDITQDTFLKVWKNLKKYKDEYSFNTWIINIARNTAIDYLRKKRPLLFSDFDKADDEESFEESLIDIEPLQNEIFEAEENKSKLDEALGKLNLEKKTILLMHINEEQTFEEISKILNKPMNSVKSQYRRALIELRKYIS